MSRQKNIMEMVPVRNEKVEWEKKNGIITLKIKRQGMIDRFMHRIFKSPQEITVELEEIGSFIWEQCNGTNDVHHISLALNEHFGDKAAPVVDRLIKYIKILINNNFIRLDAREK